MYKGITLVGDIMFCSLIACLIGFVLDLIFGDPNFGAHPIRLIGKLISSTEKMLRKIFPSDKLKIAGFFLVLIVCGVSFGISALILYLSYNVNKYLGIGIEALICFFMLSAKSLKKESMKVYNHLSKGDVEGARKAVSMIVGRDTAVLDEKGIAKAAVETVAENLSDGVIAPLLYMFVGGGSLSVLYKAINTMDSMVAYKNENYIDFGFFAAKLDDIANFIPSRLSALLLVFSAFLGGKDYKKAFKIFKRDRFNHASPNSAQTESACAGALGIQLGGDAYYFGKLYKKKFIGDFVNEVNYRHIYDINRLMYISAFSCVFIFALVKGVLLGGVLL